MLKRSLATLATLVAVSALAGCGGSDSDGDAVASDTASSSGSASGSASSAPERTFDGSACTFTEDGQAVKDAELPSATSLTGTLTGTIATSAGDIGVTLDATSAPCTVTSFVSLADQGYFDGTTCHRLTTAGIFVLQCGDPSGTGAGGPGYSFGDELKGTETYGPGTLAMANAGPDTNGSQFFIVYGDSQLSPDYTVFGSIDAAGLKVVEDVAADGADDSNGQGDGAPNTPVDIDSVTVS